MTLSFLPKNPFPIPASLAPKLIALGLDDITAAKVSEVYISSAISLKETCETEYVRACNAFMVTSDDRGYSSKELRSKLLTVLVTRYMQALSKCLDESVEKAKAFLLRKNKKPAPQPKVNKTTFLGKPSKEEGVCIPKPSPFSTISPPHAFPHAYPPQVWPESITFVTQMPLLKRGSERDQGVTSDCDIETCILALGRLSLESPPPSRGSGKPSKTVLKPPSHTHTTPCLKLTSQLSPSRPRLVSPMLDTSVAVSHKSSPENNPRHSSPINIPRTKNVDIPRSNRRKVCSIPYRRPTIHSSASPESPPPFSRTIRRTPSLISDHGSEASSPSTPPDFPSMPIPAPTFARKASFPEATSPSEHSPVRHSVWHGIGFTPDVHG